MLAKIKFWFKYNSPLGELERWIAHRTYDRYNVIKIHTLKPGYYDKDTQLLHGAMNLLVDYIEVEVASWLLYDEYKELNFFNKIVWKFKAILNKNRSRELGLCGLNNMKINIQDSKDIWCDEIRDIYLWWKDVRPNRKEPEEISGFDAFYKNHPRDFNFNRIVALTEEEEEELSNILKESLRIEEEQLKEDDDMLHRLINIRKYMWT